MILCIPIGVGIDFYFFDHLNASSEDFLLMWCTLICWPGILLLFNTLIEHNQMTVTGLEKYIHLQIITKTITIKHIVVRVLREAHAWHSSFSTFCSLQNVISECIPIKIQSQSDSLIALTPLSTRCNEIDAERQSCLYWGRTISGWQHRKEMFVTSPYRQLATCDERDLFWAGTCIWISQPQEVL